MASAGAGGATSSCSIDQLLSNGDFEAGSEPWVSFTTGQDALIYDSSEETYAGVLAHGGQRLGWLGGVPNETNRLSQTVTLPANALRLTFAGALRIQLFEEHPIVDFLRISLVASGQRLPLFEFDNGDATDDWFDIGVPVDVTPYAGQALTLEIETQIGAGPGTNFYVDDLALVPGCSP
jgi:aminopeptidase S